MAIKTDKNQRFFLKMHKAAKEKRFPLRAMFELTYKCNFSCQHCYVPAGFRKRSDKRDLKTNEVFSILDQLRDIGCFFLGFTGGEPFARDDIFDILWYGKKKGFEIIIYTNASLIDKHRADELKKIRPNKVDITIHSLKEDAFEAITRTPNSYRRVFKAVELLGERNIPLGFKCCLLKENENEIEDIEKFSELHNAAFRLDDILMPKLDGSKEPYRYRGQAPGDRSRIREKRKQRPERVPSGVESRAEAGEEKAEDLFRCGVGKGQAAITPFGELKACLMIDYPRYKISDTSLEECWRDFVKLIDNIKPGGNYRCDICDLEPYCKWCPARTWLNDHTFTRCDIESRRMAEYRHKIEREASGMKPAGRSTYAVKCYTERG